MKRGKMEGKMCWGGGWKSDRILEITASAKQRTMALFTGVGTLGVEAKSQQSCSSTRSYDCL